MYIYITKNQILKKSFKKDLKNYFEGKKITQVGLGGFSRSLKEAEFLAKNGANLIITDLFSKEKLNKEVNFLKKYKNIKYTLGEHKISDFKKRDIVFYANGIPLKNKYIECAKKNSKKTTKSVAFVFDVLEKEFGDKVTKIGITGTKGRSTVAHMAIFLIEEYLKSIKSKSKVFKIGNIRDTSNLPILEKIKEGDYVVAELDSWLLQGFGDLKISPEISIFTNFFTDHQNYYHSMKKYFKDKSFIFRFQKESNFFISNNEGKKDIKKYFDLEKIKSKKVFTNYKKIPKWKYKTFGNHNEKNISMILSLAEVLNIPEKVQKKALESFSAIEGRMEFLGEKKRILFFNDNNSTIPDSSILNIKSLKKKFPEKSIYLMAGGADKNFEFKRFAKAIEKSVYFSSLFEGAGTEKIIDNFSKNFSRFEKSDSMEKSFNFLIQKVYLEKKEKKSIVIFSPRAASFGVFKNEYDRNDQFLKYFKNFS